MSFQSLSYGSGYARGGGYGHGGGGNTYGDAYAWGSGYGYGNGGYGSGCSDGIENIETSAARSLFRSLIK